MAKMTFWLSLSNLQISACPRSQVQHAVLLGDLVYTYRPYSHIKISWFHAKREQVPLFVTEQMSFASIPNVWKPGHCCQRCALCIFCICITRIETL